MKRGGISPELHAEIWLRDGGRCVWPGCGQDAAEISHFHSRGLGGTPDGRRNDPSNLGLMCADHARISDGELGSGGLTQYGQAHSALLGENWQRLKGGALAWERAEALTRHVASLYTDGDRGKRN